MYLVSFQIWELILQFLSSGLMKLGETISYCWSHLLWSGHYGCNNGRYGCAIVMSYTEIKKAVSQWLLTVNLCISVTWPLTCAFHIPCTHIPEIIDMHRCMCDKRSTRPWTRCVPWQRWLFYHGYPRGPDVLSSYQVTLDRSCL